jgi:protease I
VVAIINMSKKVLFIIASEGYQPMEYNIPKKVLEDAGVQVITVSDVAGVAKGSDGKSEAKVDLLIDEVNHLTPSPSPYKGEGKSITDYDGLFFVGGQGAMEHLDNEASYQLLKNWQATGKLYGAICISPRILAHADVLQGKKATGWNGDGELGGILSDSGAEFVDKPVVVDGNIVTGNGPSAAKEWGEAIVKMLLN